MRRAAVVGWFALACVAGASVEASAAAHDDTAPQELKPSAIQARLEALFAIDPWAPGGYEQQRELVAALESVPPLDAAAVARWKEACAKLWAKGPKLERSSGRHFLWEKPEERGLYLVGGNDRKPKGLMVAMHGGGKGSGDAGSAHSIAQGGASEHDWLLISPEVLEKTEHGWTDSGSEEFVLQLVERAMRTWKIDSDHVFFSGHSMGGFGTWTLGAHHADRVAALTPSAGAPTPLYGPSGKYIDVDPGVIPSLRNVPMVIYQSDNDLNVPPEANRIAVEMLRRARERWGGFDFEYWEVPGRAHDLAPGGMPALFEKIGQRVRDPRPTKIVWQPVLSWKRQFYWLRWEKPERNSIVVAEVDRAANTIRVTCEPKPKSPIELLLDERLVDLAKEVVVELNGQLAWRGRPQPTLATLVKTALTGDPKLTFATSVSLVPGS